MERIGRSTVGFVESANLAKAAMANERPTGRWVILNNKIADCSFLKCTRFGRESFRLIQVLALIEIPKACSVFLEMRSKASFAEPFPSYAAGCPPCGCHPL